MNTSSFTANIDTPDKENIPFERAATFVRDTEEHIFLTGKAGSGKTTFLKYIKGHCNKRCAIVAPTGIAAINAGGETIHSFLQLPFGPFVPGNAGGFGKAPGHVEDKHSLLARLRLRDTKIQLLRKLELLIIDEVSMVRADLLDAMDLVLRHVRKQYSIPFGGVQMLFIGDLYQLPPVAPPDDWEILKRFYPGTYFFDSEVIRQNPPLYIELTKIYRQKDGAFIEILNRVRTGQSTKQDIETLNARYEANATRKGYIMLCTHNHLADTINKRELESLPGPLHTFEGKINNDFSLKNLPAEMQLELKEGAQVMFIKNDVQTPRRYYNGKIAVISSITPDGIKVTFPDDKKNETLIVEQETWRNIKYSLDNQTGSITEDETGSYTQYPLRLAWAITVHKSQGLTLEHAIVDLNRSFAAGQVYVALSRCTSIEGLLLSTRLVQENIMADPRVLAFADYATDEDELEERLEVCRRKAAMARVIRIISFTELIATATQLTSNLEKRKTGPAQQNKELCVKLLETLTQAQKHAEGFHSQLIRLFEAGNIEQAESRKQAAATYFSTKVLQQIADDVEAHMQLFGKLPAIAKQTKLWKTYKVSIDQKQKEINALITPFIT